MKKKLKWLLLIFCTGTLFSIWVANYQVERRTDGLVFSNTENIHYNRVGLLLGTSKLLRGGTSNQYFQHRITAAMELYRSGKITYLIISGDNSRKEYNEPQDMKEELVKNGIPARNIFLDYAGFSTYESVVRIREIFGQTRFTVISQEFHTRRAVFIANELGMDATGYNASDVKAYSGLKTRIREKFARVKVFLDLWFESDPTFLGEKIEVK